MPVKFSFEPIEVASNPRLKEFKTVNESVEWIVGDKPVSRTYAPAKEPELFLKFARTTSKSQSILRFVRKYGIPTCMVPVPITAQADESPAGVDFAVRRSDFEQKAFELAFLLELLAAMDRKDWPFVRRHRNQIVALSSHFNMSLRSRVMHRDSSRFWDSLNPDMYSLVGPVDPVERTRMLLGMQINFYTDSIWVGTGYNEQERIYHKAMVRGFLPTIYAQLLDYHQHGGRFGLCKRCGKPFMKRRPNHLYCDHFCRDRANSANYRAKKHQAVSSSPLPSRSTQGTGLL